ncbi:hypothetical protein ACQEV9_18130 [Streptomyces chartreusis]|uniref:hypothetical protein n=1 Tax=Streptomyces chartreusis TaxID=1969 RepID=UPI003D8C2586
MERTDPDAVDVALRVLLTEPSYAAQTLIVAARMLEMDAASPITANAREHAMDIATDVVLAKLPEAVDHESRRTAYRALPPLAPAGTRGEYAHRLRAVAEDLG